MVLEILIWVYPELALMYGTLLWGGKKISAIISPSFSQIWQAFIVPNPRVCY